jgi:uncharacterized protein YndB with AHSA1/START domain
MSEKKPPRVLELEVEIDAPIADAWKAISEGAHMASWFSPQATVSRPGEGGEVTVAWAEGQSWTTKIGVWKPGEHLRWVDASEMFGPGTVVWVDFILTHEKGKTRLRLVQSGFGESGGWDDFFEGTEAGWSYFLCNLRLYVQRHFGKARHMIAQRFEVKLRRDLAWERILGATTGLVVAGNAALEAGANVALRLGDAAPLSAVVEVLRPQRALAFRIAELDDALLFVELESGDEAFHLGLWMSVYDADTAARLRKPVLAQWALLQSSLAR